MAHLFPPLRSSNLVRNVHPARIASAALIVVCFAVNSSAQNPSKILERRLASPSTVEWKVGKVEIFLLKVAWGPANSPEMISKGYEVKPYLREHPEFFPDKTYALALQLRATVPQQVATGMATSSRLTRIRNVEGDLEGPWELTPSGFAHFSGSPGAFDITFNPSDNDRKEFWDFFPVSPDEKEFLFQVVHPGGVPENSPPVSFRIVLKSDDLLIVNTAPRPASACPQFSRKFTGTIGASAAINVQLTRDGEMLSGTEQYATVGTTLWLKGSVDQMGNVLLEERYPEDRVTGTLRGKLSPNCRMITGYFSKPDGSRLQPFELHEGEAGH